MHRWRRVSGPSQPASASRCFVCVFFACLVVPAVTCIAAEPISTGTLLREMVDMTRLGNFPAPAYKTVQFSSYDRRANVPGGPNWFANSDGFGREPIPNFQAVLQAPEGDEPGRYLICDVQGPGAIVRTWSAAIEGTLRVVLDESDEPLYEGPASEFLQSGLETRIAQLGIDRELYERTYRQRDACYFPIPFARRCRIEWIGNHQRIHFYEVQVRKYDAGTDIQALTPSQLPSLTPVVRQVAQILSDPSGQWAYHSSQEPVGVECKLPAGQSSDLWQTTGPQAIESLTLKLAAQNVDLALRQTILTIRFDGASIAQVFSPVGDFFGSAPGINPYNEVPFTVDPDGSMTCRFVMPFARKCVISVANYGEQGVDVTGNVRLHAVGVGCGSLDAFSRPVARGS